MITFRNISNEKDLNTKRWPQCYQSIDLTFGFSVDKMIWNKITFFQPLVILNTNFQKQSKQEAHCNWQLPFLNQRKGENDRRKYFMINLHERMLLTSVGIEPAAFWSPVGWRIQMNHRGRLYTKVVLWDLACENCMLAYFMLVLILISTCTKVVLLRSG